MDKHRLWVIAESNKEEVMEPSLEVLTEVSRLAARRRDAVMVLLCGPGQADSLMPVLGVYGADAVLCMSGGGDITARQAGSYIAALAQEHRPDAVFAADTLWGHDALAWLAAGLKTSLVSGCVELGLTSDKKVVVTRHIYAGNVAVKYAGEGGSPLVAVVQPGLFNVKKTFPAKKTKIVEIPAHECCLDDVRPVEYIKADPRIMDVADAERLVVGGRGMGSAEKFGLIHEAAGLLGAAVAGTRVARDYGWISLERQIGQTGKTVAPDLLISCGVSGAMQHTMGLKETRYLVAINTDKSAPIFRLADLCIVEDAAVVLKGLIAKLKTGAEG